MNYVNQGWLKRTVVCLLLLTFISATGLPYLFAQSQGFSQTFKKGDALRLIVWQPWSTGDGKSQGVDLNGDYTIDNRGYAFFPLIGEVNVLSHNTSSLADDLKNKFSSYMQDPVVVVRPLIRITLQGAFQRPGTYLVEPNESLWQVVDLAGGPEVNANLEKLAVIRNGKKVKENLLSGFERAYSIQEIGIYSGDQIVLPARSSFGRRDALEILRFGISILQLYLLVDRL